MAINYDVEYPKLQRRVAELQRQLNESPEAMTIRFLAADLRANELQAKLDKERDAMANWVLNTCPGDYHHYQKLRQELEDE